MNDVFQVLVHIEDCVPRKKPERPTLKSKPGETSIKPDICSNVTKAVVIVHQSFYGERS